MTLSLALNAAVSGLRATTAQTGTISSNVANSLTEGYARREVAISSNAVSPGVRVEGVVRASASAVTEARRLADASAGDGNVRSSALTRLAGVTGEPGEPSALATAADVFDAALGAAADTPESAALLSGAVSAAVDYGAAVNRIAAEAMALRTESDSSIASQVRTINDSLTKVQSLNAEIKSRSIGGGDTSALEDQRERLIKDVSSMIPVRVIPRELGTVAIFAANGAQLLDGKVFELGFAPTALVTPEQTLANGALSGITVNGVAMRIGEGGGRGLLDGGSLSAAFEMRDVVIPGVTAALDDLAADLITRTQGLGADPTIGPGAAGLFTDEGGAYDAADLTGVSLRISVNAAVNPAAGGAVFRLRDGIEAASPGDVGISSVLRGLQDVMEELRAAPPGSGLTGQRGAAGFAGIFSADVISRANAAENEATFRTARQDELIDAELSRTGVDTDQQMARLLVVEQAFAANARVVQVIDGLLERLINL